MSRNHVSAPWRLAYSVSSWSRMVCPCGRNGRHPCLARRHQIDEPRRMSFSRARFLIARPQPFQREGADGLQHGEAGLAVALDAVHQALLDEGVDPAHPGREGSIGGVGNGLRRSNVKLPAKTARRRKSACASSESRSYDHPIVAAMVCCRIGASRGPSLSSESRSVICARRASGERIVIRAAASSMASGRPSSARQSAAIFSPLAAVRAKLGRTARARSTKRRTASFSATVSHLDPVDAGKGRGSIGRTCSPWTWRGARLAARIWRAGQDARRVATSAALAARRCSQLSSTSSVCWGRRWWTRLPKDRSVRSRDDSERTGHRHRHEIRIAERGEIHPDHASGKLIGNILRDGQRQPGLADAPRTSQGQQRDGLIEEERTRGSALALPADEPGAGNRQRSEQGRCSRSDHAGIPS